MQTIISEPILKLAKEILNDTCQNLDMQDKLILVKDGPKYLRHVQTNIKLKKDALSDLSDTAKKVLLAYVVFIRQNITTNQGDRPNEEDASMILHGEIYDNSKKDKKELNDNLLKQLSKLGINVE